MWENLRPQSLSTKKYSLDVKAVPSTVGDELAGLVHRLTVEDLVGVGLCGHQEDADLQGV